MQARSARWFFPIGLFGALAGCASRSYTPVAPHVATRPGLSASISHISLDRALTVSLRVDTVGVVRIRRVLLAPRVAEPCHEGVRDVELDLDGQRKWARPIDVGGKHEIALTYGPGSAGELLARPSTLDLVLAGDAGAPDECLRVDLTGTSPALAWKDHITGTAGGDFRGEAPVHAVNGVGLGWSFGTRIGGYVGPLRIMGEVGLGGARCSGTCYGSDIGFLWMPVGVSAHWFALGSKGTVLDLGLAYRFIMAAVGGHGESRAATIHAPELRVRFGTSAERGPGLPSGARVANAGYELFASEWFSDGPYGPEHAFVLGMGLVWEVGL